MALPGGGQGLAETPLENLGLGEFSEGDIPRAPSGEQGVDIRFTYVLNGLLEVEATMVDTGRKVNRLLARYPKGMSQTQIARAVDEMQKLKTHAR